MRSPLFLPDGRVVVPDNRWDLVDDHQRTPSVSVVVPYYDQPQQLALVLEALTIQTYPLEEVDVVVADDGSRERPAIDRWSTRLTVSVVRQEDRGFRAAAARNLGARASFGSILCFLDADTVPAPDYIRRAVALPAALPDAVVVGRRKHADLSDVPESAVGQWLMDDACGDAIEPRWLVDAYARTRNLLEPGWDGYRYILSAVLTCSRELFDAVGGFDESFVRYGGEDWEFANRAFMMGAVFAHEPAALAWHDGPDWAERSVPERATAKNAEALALAPLITDPAARTAGLSYRIPDLVILLSVADHTPASLMVTISSLTRGTDCAVWLIGDESESMLAELNVYDSRIRCGVPDVAILSRCRFFVEVRGRVVASADSVARLVEHVGPGRAGGVTVEFDTSAASLTMWSSRAMHRAQRWSTLLQSAEDDVRRTLFGVHRSRATDVGLTVASEEPWLSW